MNPRRGPHERGVAMLLVLLTVAMAMVIGLSFLGAQQTSGGIVRNIVDHGRARQIAESGMLLTLAEIRSNSEWRTSYPNGEWFADQALNGGSFTIFVEDGIDPPLTPDDESDGSLADDASDSFTLTAVGAFDGVTHTLRAYVAAGESDIGISRIAVTAKAHVEDHGRIDSFRSESGAYGGGNIGSEALVSTNSKSKNKLKVKNSGVIAGDAFAGPGGNVNTVIKVENSGQITGDRLVLAEAIPVPTPQEPTGMSASVGDRTYSSGTTALSADLHCNKLTVKSSAILQISGQVTILAENDVEFKDDAQLRINAGSSLRLYSKRKLKIKDDAVVNVDSADPARLLIFHLSAEDFKIMNDARMYATAIAPQRKVVLEDDAQFYGTLAAKELIVRNDSRVHHDLSTGYDSTGAVLEADVAVSDKIELQNSGRIDSFNSALGNYGGGNVGSDARVATNSTGHDKIVIKDSAVLSGNAYAGPGANISNAIKVQGSGQITGVKAALAAPILIPNVGDPEITSTHNDLTYSSGTTVINTDINCAKLVIQNASIIQIEGEVIINARKEIVVQNTAKIELLEGASLTMIADKKIEFKDSALVNVNTTDPRLVSVQQLSGQDVVIDGSARVYAQILHPDSELQLKSSGQLYGTTLGKRLIVKDTAKLHADIVDRDESGSENGGGTGGSSGYSVTWAEQP